MVDIHAQFKGVQKSYDGESLVVEELNLDIESGEFLTMLGPSGSGKTTCLMMLAGFETVTRGDIFINGKAINRIPPHKRGIGMVFQNYALFPHMTVLKTWLSPCKCAKSRNQTPTKKSNGLWKWCNSSALKAGDRDNYPAGSNSAWLWRGRLFFEPSLVLMDEPLGALDKKSA